MTARPFVTPINERSFSGLIDRCVLETGKSGALLTAIQYANLTIRECQALGLFASDLLEDRVLATDAPFSWTRPTNFRSLRLVQYGTSGDYPKFRMPGRGKNDDDTSLFYAAGNYFVFNGVVENEYINYAVYLWAQPLRYFSYVGLDTTAFPGGPYTTRRAYYDIDTATWYYLDTDDTTYVTTLGDTDEELLRRNNASNWLVQDWYDLILEGVKTKLFKQFNDERQSASYALYKQGQQVLRNTSGSEVESFNIVDSQ